MFGAIDHVGIAVDDLDAAVELYSQTFEMPVQHRETNDDEGVEAVLLGVGESHVELLAPLGDDTPVGKFIAKRGPGMHHTAYRCDDIGKALEQCRERGLRPIDEKPRVGIRNSLVAFLHPSTAGRVLIELVQPVDDH
jgi:methylmalonyl-CoA epimerase